MNNNTARNSQAARNMPADMTVDQIRTAGKKCKLSYIQALSLYLFERVLHWVSRSELKDEMWLKRPELPGKGKDINSNEIIFYMKKISYLTLLDMAAGIFQDKEEHVPRMNWEMLFYDRQLEIVLDMRVEHVAFPFKVIIRPVWDEEQYPEKETYQLRLIQGEEIHYAAYPMELELAECMYEILDKLELIHDMQPYGTACQILRIHPVNGRRMFQNLSDFFEKQKISSMERRWDTVLGYKSYTYMKKRWNKYEKSLHMGLSWEECLELLNLFFTPIWEAIREDRVFFGDWMPHLGRYLD